MYRIIPYETKTDKNQGTDMNPADDPDLQPLQPPQNPLPAPTPQLPTDGVAPPDPVFAQAVVSAQSLTQQPAPPTAPGVEQPAVQPFTAPEPVNPTDQVTDQFSSQPVVSPDLDTFAVPDTKPARRKLPLIIAGSAMAVLMVVGAGWFFVGQDMLDSNGALAG